MLGLMEAEAISERTTVGVFARQAERLADRVILRHHQDGGWRELKWSDLRDLVIRVGARLVEEGVGAGDRVILMSENRVEWLYCDLAIQASGGLTAVAPLRDRHRRGGGGGDRQVSTASRPWLHCGHNTGTPARHAGYGSPRPHGRGSIAGW